MKYDNNLRVAVKIINDYKGSTPLASWLKDYFRNNKQMGSSDRRIISTLVYSYFRLGSSLKNTSPDKKILAALFLINTSSTPFLQHIKPEWDQQVSNDLVSKIAFLKKEEGLDIAGEIFPYTNELSSNIEVQKFEQSFLKQPNLFFRIRPGKKQVVIQKLQKAGISYTELDNTCITMANATKMDEVIKADEEAVIQDYNSQRTGIFLKYLSKETRKIKVWDCCAASGGKSIMAFDLCPRIELTVSDKRRSIIENLKKRFSKAGISRYHSIIVDLSQSKPALEGQLFDLIICDAPCTGSGTWSRTPEQLYFFKQRSIESYSMMQKHILENVLPYLAPGGKLLYITCSVFKKENEEVVKHLTDHLHLHLLESSVLKGYDLQADTMYAALLSKPLIQ